MFVIKEMRINKFEARPIVSNRELFVAKGQCPGTIVSKDTADCFDQPSVEGASKTKILGLARDICVTAFEKHKEGDKAPSLPGQNAKDM